MHTRLSTLLPARLTGALVLVFTLMAGTMAARAADGPVLDKFLPDLTASDVVAGADAFGPVREDLAVAPVLKSGETVAWVFVTSDFVGTTGYSGKPIKSLSPSTRPQRSWRCGF